MSIVPVVRSSASAAFTAVVMLVALGAGLRPDAAGAQVVESAPVAAAPPAPTLVDREVKIAENAFTRDATLPAWVAPAPIPEAKAEGAVTQLLLENQVRVGEPVVAFNHLAMRVNDATALSNAGRVPVVFVPDYQRVVLHVLRIWRGGVPQDRLAGAQIRFLQRETGLEQNLYSGVVTASILLDDLRVDDTIEVAYSIVGANPVFGATFSWLAGWDQQGPLAMRRFVLASPPARHVAWKGLGNLRSDVPQPREGLRDGLRTLTFEERDLAAIKPEPQLQGGFSIGRFLEFSEHADWQDVATWASTLFDVREAPDAARRALVDGWKAKPTDEERIVAALEFVQSQVRYFSVSIGTSSHRPASPNTVLARRYGDCKDKSLLLVALLADLGIQARPVLARIGNRVGFDDWLPTPLAFDHVFVTLEVGGVRYWLDPTRLGQHGKLARMGQVHDGAEVLVADRGTRALERVGPASGAMRDELARNDLTEDLVVEKLDGAGTLTIDRAFNGVAAETVRVLFGAMTADRIETAIANDVQKVHPDAHLDGHVTIDDDRLENRLRMHYRFALPTALRKVPEGWTVKFVPDNLIRTFVLPPEAGDGQRRAPVALSYPVDASYRFDLHLPDAVSAGSADAPAHIDNAYFDWTSERSFRGNHAYATIRLVTLQPRIAPKDLGMLRADVLRIDRAQPTNFLVRAGDVRKAGILGIGAESVADKIRIRQEQRVTALGRSITVGKLAPRDLARAHCERGQALAMLERFDEARKDGDQAVEADPSAASTFACRAAIRLATRDAAGAVEDASQAIVLGDDGGTAYFVRGRAEFAIGRFPAALEDFGRVDAGADGRTAVPPTVRDIWRAMTYRRMGRALPAELVQPDAEGGAWPRPVLALFAERITPARLAELSQKPGDQGELNATEADFYIGEYHLAKGSLDEASKAFESARRRGIIDYVEYEAAGMELARIKAKPAGG